MWSFIGPRVFSFGECGNLLDPACSAWLHVVIYWIAHVQLGCMWSFIGSRMFSFGECDHLLYPACSALLNVVIYWIPHVQLW